MAAPKKSGVLDYFMPPSTAYKYEPGEEEMINANQVVENHFVYMREFTAEYVKSGTYNDYIYGSVLGHFMEDRMAALRTLRDVAERYPTRQNKEFVTDRQIRYSEMLGELIDMFREQSESEASEEELSEIEEEKEEGRYTFIKHMPARFVNAVWRLVSEYPQYLWRESSAGTLGFPSERPEERRFSAKSDEEHKSEARIEKRAVPAGFRNGRQLVVATIGPVSRIEIHNGGPICHHVHATDRLEDYYTKSGAGPACPVCGVEK